MTVSSVAREAEQVPPIVDKLVNGIALYERGRSLLRADEVEGHQQEEADEDRPRHQLLRRDWHRRWCRVGDDMGHGSILSKDLEDYLNAMMHLRVLLCLSKGYDWIPVPPDYALPGRLELYSNIVSIAASGFTDRVTHVEMHQLDRAGEIGGKRVVDAKLFVDASQ